MALTRHLNWRSYYFIPFTADRASGICSMSSLNIEFPFLKVCKVCRTHDTWSETGSSSFIEPVVNSTGQLKYRVFYFLQRNFLFISYWRVGWEKKMNTIILRCHSIFFSLFLSEASKPVSTVRVKDSTFSHWDNWNYFSQCKKKKKVCLVVNHYNNCEWQNC